MNVCWATAQQSKQVTQPASTSKELESRLFLRRLLCCAVLSRVCSVTPWTVAHQAPLSMGLILQARILEWVAISYSRRFSQPRDQTRISCISCIGRQILYCYASWVRQNEYLLNNNLIHHNTTKGAGVNLQDRLGLSLFTSWLLGPR